MLLHWYTCISINTYCYVIYHILSETVWWALSNASLIMWIHPVFHKISANKDFTVTDDLISQLFAVAFIHTTYVQIAPNGALQCNLVCENQSTGCGDTSWMKFVTHSYYLFLCQAFLSLSWPLYKVGSMLYYLKLLLIFIQCSILLNWLLFLKTLYLVDILTPC